MEDKVEITEIEDDCEEEELYMPTSPDQMERRRQKYQRKNQKTIDGFLGIGRKESSVSIMPRYYCELLTWALHRYMERKGWKIIKSLGYHSGKPVYIDVDTCENKENLLMDGQLLIKNGDSHLIVTLEANPRYQGSLLVEGLKVRENETKTFVNAVMDIAKKENFYRGKKFEYSGRIRFLNLNKKTWDKIVIEAETKKDIQTNTIDFLKFSERWAKFGIPLKRGILLSGEPGTGKTVICKVIMSLADGITCITTNGYDLCHDFYICELYEIAEDLSPSMVFIEDIDLIGQDRIEFGQSGPALQSLLSILDGVEEHNGIITIATTNCLDILDKALSQRPSRFDRVIQIARPSFEQRKELLDKLSQKIQVDENSREYIALKTDGYTPAQIQEIIYSLVIQHPSELAELSFSRTDIDLAISRIKGKSKYQIGFVGNDNHNGHKCIINIQNQGNNKRG